MTSTNRTATAGLALVAGLLLATSAAAQTKEAPPAPGTPKDVKLPPKKTFTLDNGMRVSLVPFGTIPMAAIQLNIRAGNINESAETVDLSDVTGDLVKEGGTVSRTGEQVARDAASMGGTIGVGVSPDQTTISSEVLSERTADMVRLIAELAYKARLPESDLGRVKSNLLRNIAINKTVPQNIATEKFNAALYGDHPYGRMWPKDGTVEKYTIEQARAFYKDNYVAQRAHLMIVGVYDAAAVERAIRDAFTAWERGTPPLNLPVPPGPTQRSVALFDRPDAPQSTLQLGLRIPPPASADYIPIRVADRLLGGSFGSRITSNIREDKGYTYSPFSTTSAQVQSTIWYEGADVTTKDTGNSLKEIFAEIDKLTKEAPTQKEVRGFQNEMVGVFALQTSSRTGIVTRLTFADLHGVGDQYLTNYIRNIMAVTPEDVRRVTATYFTPAKMTMIVVGDKKTVEPQLAPWATVVP